MQKVEAEWDVVEWGYLQHYRAAIPAQPEGTLVRYFLTARMAGGEEIAADGGKYYAYYVTGTGTARVGARRSGLPGHARSLFPRHG